MKIYLAARYGRATEMREIAAVLRNHGHKITSRWIEGFHDADQNPEYAQEDFDDVVRCDAVVSVTGDEGGRSRGGRHVEFGIGLALKKRMIVLGIRENVFHTLHQVEVYTSIRALLDSL